jgi:Flp pilus assembly protein TadD
LQSLSLLGWALDFAGAGEQAVAVLRRAQQQYPGDFTINFQLAWALDHQRPTGPDVRAEAIRFYTVARALRPRNVPVHNILGHALCGQGKVDEASTVFRKVTELKPDEVLPHYWLALTQLAAGDRDGYRGTCATMLGRFGGTDRPDVAYWVAWTCVLGPDAATNADRPVELAEAAFGGPPEAGKYSLGLGAALYRAGRFGEAIRCCKEAVPRTAALSAYTGFFLAMAHHRAGHGAEARECLSQARTWAERDVEISLPWNRRLTLQLLRREAEALIHE